MADRNVRVTLKFDMAGFEEAMRAAARAYIRDNMRVERQEPDAEES